METLAALPRCKLRTKSSLVNSLFIVQECIRALNQTWHPEHFSCYSCQVYSYCILLFQPTIIVMLFDNVYLQFITFSTYLLII
jgi:hypothetical protein